MILPFTPLSLPDSTMTVSPFFTCMLTPSLRIGRAETPLC